jgi:hypothetical protein
MNSSEYRPEISISTASGDCFTTAYLTARFKQMTPSDAPAREQILGYFDYLERLIADGSFRGCPYVNAVAELGDPKHPATGIALQFKEQRRRLWYKALLERIGVKDPAALAIQLQILAEGVFGAALVRGDPAIARSARAAAEVLIDAAVGNRGQSPIKKKRRGQAPS